MSSSSQRDLIFDFNSFCYGIWDHYLQKNINLLETVQRRAARFITEDYHTTSSVTNMLQDLGLHEIKDHHRDLWLALMFNVVHGHVGVDATSIGLTPADSCTTAKHKYKFCVLGSNTYSFKFSSWAIPSNKQCSS